MTAIMQAALRYFAPPTERTPPLVQETSLWFRLPLELREQIYTDFFAEHVSPPLYISPTEISIFGDPIAEDTHHTALLRTCKAIYAEALPIIHATHNIHLLISDPLILAAMPAPPTAPPIVYHPPLPVCSRSRMLELLQQRLAHVTITVRLTSVSPHTLIVQKLAWLLEMLGRRGTRLASLNLHVLDNLSFFAGCCEATEYEQGSRWDVYPPSTVEVVATSRNRGLCRVEKCGCQLLQRYAEEWEAVVSVNEGRVAMGQTARGHWARITRDVPQVEDVLRGQRRWWELHGPADVWDRISENPYRFY